MFKKINFGKVFTVLGIAVFAYVILDSVWFASKHNQHHPAEATTGKTNAVPPIKP